MENEEIRHYESLTQQLQRIHHSHSRAPSSCILSFLPLHMDQKLKGVMLTEIIMIISMNSWNMTSS